MVDLVLLLAQAAGACVASRRGETPGLVVFRTHCGGVSNSCEMSEPVGKRRKTASAKQRAAGGGAGAASGNGESREDAICLDLDEDDPLEFLVKVRAAARRLVQSAGTR